MPNDFVHTANPRAIAKLPQDDSELFGIFHAVIFKIYLNDKGMRDRGLGVSEEST